MRLVFSLPQMLKFTASFLVSAKKGVQSLVNADLSNFQPKSGLTAVVGVAPSDDYLIEISRSFDWTISIFYEATVTPSNRGEYVLPIWLWIFQP